MTIDERLEKLAERHEALAQAMELHRLEAEDRWRKEDERWEAVRKAFASALESIQSLERIASAHERRISDLENPQ